MAVRTTDDIARQARRIEALGFDYLSVGEHVAFHAPVTHSLIVLAGAATVTTKIRLLTGVLQLPLYPPALAAKMTAALDVISNGRLCVGVGIGGEHPAEFDACGVPTSERGVRTDEALEVLRLCWSGSPVSFAGRFTRFEDVIIAPPPTQVPGPPIWIAGRRGRALRRVARYGDGWLPYMVTPDMMRQGRAELDVLCRDEGRDPADVRTCAYLFACCHEDRQTAERLAAETLGQQYAQDFQRLVGRYAIVGTPEQCVNRLLDYVDAGVATVILSPACPPSYLPKNQEMLCEVAEIVRAETRGWLR